MHSYSINHLFWLAEVLTVYWPWTTSSKKNWFSNSKQWQKTDTRLEIPVLLTREMKHTYHIQSSRYMALYHVAERDQCFFTCWLESFLQNANIDKLWQSDLCLDKLFVRSNIIKYVYWIHLSQKLQNNYNLRLTDLDAGVCSSFSGKYSGKVLLGIAVKFLFWLLLPVWVEEENGTFTYKIHLLKYIYIIYG